MPRLRAASKGKNSRNRRCINLLPMKNRRSITINKTPELRPAVAVPVITGAAAALASVVVKSSAAPAPGRCGAYLCGTQTTSAPVRCSGRSRCAAAFHPAIAPAAAPHRANAHAFTHRRINIGETVALKGDLAGIEPLQQLPDTGNAALFAT